MSDMPFYDETGQFNFELDVDNGLGDDGKVRNLAQYLRWIGYDIVAGAEGGDSDFYGSMIDYGEELWGLAEWVDQIVKSGTALLSALESNVPSPIDPFIEDLSSSLRGIHDR